MLTIAHRLNTVMDSDRIVVMEQGQVSKTVVSIISRWYSWVSYDVINFSVGQLQIDI